MPWNGNLDISAGSIKFPKKLPIFSRDTHKGQTYGHICSSHNASYGQNGRYGHYGLTNYDHKIDLYGFSWKICSKCRSPVKMVLKKIKPTEFFGQNKIMWEKMAIFKQFPSYNWSNLKMSGGGGAKLMAQKSWNLFGGLLTYIDSPGQNCRMRIKNIIFLVDKISQAVCRIIYTFNMSANATFSYCHSASRQMQLSS